MRPLVMDFSHDKKVWDLKYQYMFGKSILVAPVTEAQYTPEETEDNWLDEAAVDFTTKKESQVYLPAGSRWYDFWTNEIFNGGKEIVKETSIDIIPLYIKAGTILPVGPEVQYATEKNWDNLELRIYEGADGEFTLYEDENDNYNYEKGIYSTITFSWNDADKKLTISSREGSFPGMLKERNFNIVRVGKNRATGMETVDKFDKVVNYSGEKVEVQF
jgi:alpha-D-xyloside xylohydrolase